jgi:hypothetical protein
MGAGKDGNAVVIAAEAEVETACPLIIGVSQGCDGQTKSAGEWLPQLRETVEKRIEREALRTGARAMLHGFDECDLDSGITNINKDTLDGIPSDNGSVVNERVRLHADGYNEVAEGIGLPGVGVSERVNGS